MEISSLRPIAKSLAVILRGDVVEKGERSQLYGTL
jgi:hypothetical protein